MNKNRCIVLMATILIVSCFIQSQDKRVIPGLVNPTSLQIDEKQIYVADDDSIFIFDRATHKKMGQFGKSGEGPQEFITYQQPLAIFFYKDYLLITSMGKASYWTKTGQFVKAVIYQYMTVQSPKPLNDDQFLAAGTKQNEIRVWYRTINVCDAKMNILKELYRVRHEWQGRNKGTSCLSDVFGYLATGNRVFLPGKQENEIDIFDNMLNKMLTVSVPKETRDVDQAFKDKTLSELKANPMIGSQIEEYMPLLYPDQFPSISGFVVDERHLYAFTWKFTADKIHYHTFDAQSGQSLGEKAVRLCFQYVRRPYPFTIKNGVLYQLIETDGDDWVLSNEKL